MLSPGVHPLREVISRALHDPAHGYYTRHIRGVGRRGDFATSATLGRGLARAVAAWLREVDRKPRLQRVVEIGAGDGRLAQEVRRALPWWSPLRRHVHLVETSPVLRQVQQSRLGRAVRWHERPGKALATCGGRAHLFANELIDAFPPTVIEWSGGGWREVALEVTDDGRVRETLVAAAPETLDAGTLNPACWPGGAPPEGQRIEVLDSFRDWWREWLPRWEGGDLLWIDYGGGFPGIYHRRPRGTLRAYFHHQRMEGLDVFRHLGKQDITCDVDFDAVQRWGEEAGLTTVDRLAQRDFLGRFAPGGDADPALQAGEAFQVLWMRREG